MYRFSPNFLLRTAALTLSAASLALLSGCGGMTGSALSTGDNSVTLPKGTVHGGQSPIAGAHVYVFATGTTGYGSAATSLITGSGSSDSVGGYVLSDANGDFSFGGYASCQSGQLLYLLAIGGNPNGLVNGPSNGALKLMAPLGLCQNVNGSTFVNVNEVTTVLSATALQQYMLQTNITNGTVVGTNVGTTSSLAGGNGLLAAFTGMSNLVNTQTGTALATTPAGNGKVPMDKINTLADILAPCVNSSGAGSQPCQQLFSDLTIAGGPNPPTDTLGAALQIAQLPAYNSHQLCTDALLAGAPFQPTISCGTTSPNDFSIGVTYTDNLAGTTLVQPGQLVIDSAGDIWMANCQSCNSATPLAQDSITEFGPTGTVLGNYSNVAIHKTQGLAIDSLGNVWSANAANGTRPDEVFKMTSAGGTPFSGFPLQNANFVGLSAIATDASNNAWITASGTEYGSTSTTSTGFIFLVSPSGTITSTLANATTGVIAPLGVGIDNASNVWVAATGSSSILELNSTGGLVSPSGGYTAQTAVGLSSPIGISISSVPTIWTVDNQSNQVNQVSSTGTDTTGYSVSIYQAALIAVDGSNNAFIPNCRDSCPGSGDTTDPDELIWLGSGGQDNTGAKSSNPVNRGLQNSGFNGVGGVAIDEAGNVWVANSVSGTITEMYGIAEPVITPLGLAVKSGLVGTRP